MLGLSGASPRLGFLEGYPLVVVVSRAPLTSANSRETEFRLAYMGFGVLKTIPNANQAPTCVPNIATSPTAAQDVSGGEGVSILKASLGSIRLWVKSADASRACRWQSATWSSFDFLRISYQSRRLLGLPFFGHGVLGVQNPAIFQCFRGLRAKNLRFA